MESRTFLEEELKKRNFIPRILKINMFETKKELFAWHVETCAGARVFFTRLREQFRTLANGNIIINDINGDIYIIQNPKSLDKNSQQLLWRYLD